jgi:serine/threonine protein kinase
MENNNIIFETDMSH